VDCGDPRGVAVVGAEEWALEQQLTGLVGSTQNGGVERGVATGIARFGEDIVFECEIQLLMIFIAAQERTHKSRAMFPSAGVMLVAPWILNERQGGGGKWLSALEHFEDLHNGEMVSGEGRWVESSFVSLVPCETSLVDDLVTAPEVGGETELCATDRGLHGLLREQDVDCSVKRKAPTRILQIHSSVVREEPADSIHVTEETSVVERSPLIGRCGAGEQSCPEMRRHGGERVKVFIECVQRVRLQVDDG
jgi:hypothetical protein